MVEGKVQEKAELKEAVVNAEKRAHREWFNKGFEFYREQHLLTRLES